MKKRNKFLALFLAAAMSVSFTACGNADDGKQTVQDGGTEDKGSGEDGQGQDEESKDGEESGGKSVDEILASSRKSMEEVKSLNAQSVVEMGMKVSAEGQEQTVDSVTTMDMSCFYNPVLAKVDMTMDMGELGTQKMNMYMEEADGKYKMYVSSDGATWKSQEIDAPTAEQYDAAANMMVYMDNSFEEAGTETLETGNALKYTGAITGEKMKEVMLASGALNSLSTYGIDASQADSMISDLGEIPITFWIDEETFYPVKYELDETEVMNALMPKIIESLGEEAKGLTMEFTKATMQMTCSDFNAAEEIKIPDEAKKAE